MRKNLGNVGKRVGAIRDLADELSLRLLERTEAPIRAHKGYLCADLDTFVMDNSDTRREVVSCTYQGMEGHTPIALHLGNEGWNMGLEVRAGSHPSARETESFLEHVFPRLQRLCPKEARVLWRDDSAFDSARLLFAKAEAAGVLTGTRPGKRAGLLDLTIERAWGKEKRMFRLAVQIAERTVDQKGRSLLVPDSKLQGWWTRLDTTPTEVIELHQRHGAHEQFHSEFKTDLDRERLPSGKFDTNDCLLPLASFAYHCLRLLGQLGLAGEIAPIRHPARRRRIKTVLQEILYRAAKFVAHARRRVLDFGRIPDSYSPCPGPEGLRRPGIFPGWYRRVRARHPAGRPGFGGG
jgi:hypothetical protein